MDVYDEFKKKNFIIRVNMNVDYMFKDHHLYPTENTVEGKDRLIDEMFRNFDPNKRHATRDFCEGRKEFINAQPISWEQIELEVKKRKEKQNETTNAI